MNTVYIVALANYDEYEIIAGFTDKAEAEKLANEGQHWRAGPGWVVDEVEVWGSYDEYKGR